MFPPTQADKLTRKLALVLVRLKEEWIAFTKRPSRKLTQSENFGLSTPKPQGEALKPYIEAESIDDARAPVRTAHRYIQNRLDQLDYKGFWAEKLPIGSGLIESGHKHVLQARLKITGAAWSLKNAENIAKARILRANGQWGTYWAK